MILIIISLHSPERMTVNHDVTGSSPVGGATKVRRAIYEPFFNANRQIKHTYTNRPESDTITENAKGGCYDDRKGRSIVSQKIYGQQTERTEILP